MAGLRVRTLAMLVLGVSMLTVGGLGITETLTVRTAILTLILGCIVVLSFHLGQQCGRPKRSS